MRRILLLVLLVAAAAGFATPSYAFLTPGKTTGTELALLPTGPSAWDITIESDQAVSPPASALNFSIINATSFVANVAVCNNTNVFCTPQPGGAVGGIPNALYWSISMLAGADLGSNPLAPRTLGSIQTAGMPSFNLDPIDLDNTIGVAILPPPVDYFVGVPEPAAFVFVAMGLGSLATLRRRSA